MATNSTDYNEYGDGLVPPLYRGTDGTSTRSGSPTGEPNKVPQSTTGPVAPVPEDGPGFTRAGSSGPDALVQTLIGQGYDPTRAEKVAALLLANAGKTPSVQTPNVPGITAGSITPGTATAPTPVEQQTYEGLLGYGTGIGIGPTTATTREVQDNELVQNQLEGLLSGNSRYIRNARLRGVEQANARGQFMSSFSAGAAERAALEAGLPIATADAQAYRDAATQNLNALNNFALANLERATAIDTTLIGANTDISLANMDAATRISLANLDALTRTNMANLDADTQSKIANLSSKTQLALQDAQSKLQLMMQSRSMTHETGMEQLQQSGRVELAMINADLAERLEHLAQDGRIDLQNLTHEQQQELDAIRNQYEFDQKAKEYEYTRQTQHASLVANAQVNYITYVTSFKDTDMDAAAAARLKEDAWNTFQAEISMINGLYPEFPPITVSRQGS